MEVSKERIKQLVFESLSAKLTAQKRFIIAANWKMNLTSSEISAFAAELSAQSFSGKNELIIFPPFPYITRLRDALSVSRCSVAVGAQNAASETAGAFTGEVSAAMLADVGCKYALLGHSERRSLYGETNESVCRKIRLCHANGVIPVVCVGEPLSARKDGSFETVIKNQLTHSLAGLTPADAKRLIVAYEPVWAIGTGVVADNAQITETHAFIRQVFTQIFGAAAADVPILYGGSVKENNIASIAVIPEVAGFLIGGASLKPASFIKMARTVD